MHNKPDIGPMTKPHSTALLAAHHLHQWWPLAALLLAIAIATTECTHPLDRNHGHGI